MYFIFLEILDKIKFNDHDPSHCDLHQEDQNHHEYPPSTGRFLIMTKNPLCWHIHLVVIGTYFLSLAQAQPYIYVVIYSYKYIYKRPYF